MKAFAQKHLHGFRCGYLCALTAYSILREILPIQNIIGHPLLAYAFFAAGFGLIAASILLDRKAYQSRFLLLPAAFLLLCVLSSALHIRYGIMENAKAICWMFLYFFLLLPAFSNSKEEAAAGRRKIMWTALLLMTVLALASVLMYFFDVDYTYRNPSGFANNQGFSNQYMRLWGLFADANMAGVYSLIALCFSAYLFVGIKYKVWKAVLILADILLFCFVVLTNSRTAEVAFLGGIAWAACYIAFSHIGQKGWKRIGMAAAAAVVGMCIALGTLVGLKAGLPYAKLAVLSNTSQEAVTAVHKAYDALYRASDLNIVDGYTEEVKPPTQTPPAQIPPPQVEELDRGDKKEDISNGRFQKWSEYLQVVRHKLVFGASPRGVSAAAKEIVPESTVARFGFAAHNSLLEVLAGTGILGLAVVLAMLLWAARNVLQGMRKEPFCMRDLLYSTILVVMLCEMMFISDVFFGLTFGGVVFWMAAGSALQRKKDEA